MATEDLKRPAVFLDRDGVINENRSDHVKSWDEFIFLAGVFEPLHRLADDGRAIVVISNQAVINRGLVRRETIEGIHRQMCGEITQRGGRIDAIYYCPHRPDENCDCRKPRPGLLFQAAVEMGLDLTSSFVIGDAISDVEAAVAAGCSPILVLTGRGQEQSALLREREHGQVPIASNLAEAVGFIVS